jgi:hypothetical protein
MNYLSELQQQDSIALAEALNIVQQYIQRYLPVLQNVMQIRTRAPVTEDEPTFRGAASHQAAVPQLCNILQKLAEHVSTMEQVLAQMSMQERLSDNTEAKLKEKLLQLMSAAVKKCEEVYANKAPSFAMILHDLTLLNHLLQEKLIISHKHISSASDTAIIIDGPADVPEVVVEADEKLVYIRLFHREMSVLQTGKGSLNWIKPLLDSAKQSEKHGLAVYESEDEVRRSLKGDAYGYITAKIKHGQDISHLRPVKSDPAQGCRLLTIGNIELTNMLKLTHHAVEYWIRDGMLHKTEMM